MSSRNSISAFKKYASPYNGLSAYFKKSARVKHVIINDLTLEGDCEDMAGVAISREDKIKIATSLSEIGVPRISLLGFSPRPPPEEIETAKRILRLGLSAKLCSFAYTEEEIEIASKIGLWGITIRVPVDDQRLPKGKTSADAIKRAERLTRFAKNHGLHTSIMALYSTSARPRFLKRVVNAIEDYCDEFYVTDSMGITSPWGIRYLVENIRHWTRMSVGAHLHNHTSMAVANALAAVLGGASVLHTTVNGMGEFAGQLALEEVAVALPFHLGVSTGIKVDRLKALSDLIAKAIGVPVSIVKPVVGEAAFSAPETEEIQQEFVDMAGIKPLDEVVTFPYPATLVGRQLRMSIGRKCSELTVRYNLGIHGYTAEPSTVRAIAADIRSKASKPGGYFLMSNEDFVKMVKDAGYELIPVDTKRHPLDLSRR